MTLQSKRVECKALGIARWSRDDFGKALLASRMKENNLLQFILLRCCHQPNWLSKVFLLGMLSLGHHEETILCSQAFWYRASGASVLPFQKTTTPQLCWSICEVSQGSGIHFSHRHRKTWGKGRHTGLQSLPWYDFGMILGYFGLLLIAHWQTPSLWCNKKSHLLGFHSVPPWSGTYPHIAYSISFKFWRWNACDIRQLMVIVLLNLFVIMIHLQDSSKSSLGRSCLPENAVALEAQCVCATASRPPAPKVVRTLRRRPKGLSVQVRKTVLCVLCVKSAILDHNNDAMVLWSFWMYQMDQHKCKFTARHAPLHNVCKVLVLLLLNMNLRIGLHYFVQKIIEQQSMSFAFYFFCWTPWGGAEEGGLGDFTDLGMWATVVSRILELLEFQAGCLWGGAQEEVDSLRLCQFEGC